MKIYTCCIEILSTDHVKSDKLTNVLKTNESDITNTQGTKNNIDNTVKDDCVDSIVKQ